MTPSAFHVDKNFKVLLWYFGVIFFYLYFNCTYYLPLLFVFSFLLIFVCPDSLSPRPYTSILLLLSLLLNHHHHHHHHHHHRCIIRFSVNRINKLSHADPNTAITRLSTWPISSHFQELTKPITVVIGLS